jgi:hypothetical protein
MRIGYRLLLVFLGVIAAYLAWVFSLRAIATWRWNRAHARPETANAEFLRDYGGSEVKILQFYSPEASIVEGAPARVCYGVVNAKSLRIDPPVAGVYPAVSRCVETTPQRETRYTLTAEGEDGRTVSQSFVLGVHPDLDTLPRITSFEIKKSERDYSGKWICSLSFRVVNAEEISIDPPVFPTMHRSPYGDFYVAPKQTTTYTLTVTGKRGHQTQRQLTVRVPPA